MARVVHTFGVFFVIVWMAAVALLFPRTVVAQELLEELSAFDEPQTFPYEAEFVVSGYYSPLPGQLRYVTGTYEGDIRLNGGGVHGADGTPVFAGIIAAPPHIPFGTKMRIPGIGVTEVHDRGGAIQGNRLDVWMGEGEIGLRRALAFGMRHLTVTVYGIADEPPVAIDLESLPLARDVGFYRLQYFTSDLTLGESDEKVSVLQEFLAKFGYFDTEPNGVFDEKTRDAVFAFQRDNDIVTDAADLGAGHFGPRTRATFEATVQRKRVEYSQRFTGSLAPGSSGELVTEFQKELARLGFLESAHITGTYDEQTKQAVFRFQQRNGVVATERDIGAGYFGPKTRTVFAEALAAAYRLPTGETVTVVAAAPFSIEGLEEGPFRNNLSKGDRTDDVKKLQEELARLHLFRTDKSGYYGHVSEHAVFKFQQLMGIVEKKSDQGAGNFGPQTRAALHALIAKRDETAKLIAQHTEQYRLLVAAQPVLRNDAPLPARPVAFANDLRAGSRGEDVQKLQKALKDLGFYEGRLFTNYFGPITEKSLRTFQKAQSLIESENDPRAGVLDEKTRNALDELL